MRVTGVTWPQWWAWRAAAPSRAAAARLAWALSLAGTTGWVLNAHAAGTPPASAQTATLSPAERADDDAPSGSRLFDVDVSAPEPLDAFVSRHAELRRFQDLPDLTQTELERLLVTAPDNLRALLATQGYFSPEITLQLRPASQGRTLQTVHIQIAPGPATQVADWRVTLSGAAQDDPLAAEQRQNLQQGWALPLGHVFTQGDWDSAKRQALRQLTARRYPQARVVRSLADIDPSSHSAHLTLELDSGPAYTLGAIQVDGAQRHDAALAQRLVRLAGVQPGIPYDETLLQAAQLRLTDSGYFESAFVQMDPDGDPAHSPVQVRVREARLQKLVAGVGASTDNGARLSLEHTHHRLPGLDWRMVSSLQLERDTSTLATELSSYVNDRGWRWVTGGQLERQVDGLRVIRSQQWRLGQSQQAQAQDRSFFVQYDRTHTRDPVLAVPPETESSVSANYTWTRRRFDHPNQPTAGQGLGVELGAGLTLSQSNRPYLRARVRWQGLWPLATPATHAGRLALRLEGGAVWSQDTALVPETQRFLAGGDQSVRGYGLRDIGVPLASGGVAPGSLLTLASLEWQRPLWLKGQRSPWETVVFVDAGAVANKTRDLDPKLGVGLGARYNSPVGPLQVDLARGLDAHQWRLHMRVGFTF